MLSPQDFRRVVFELLPYDLALASALVGAWSMTFGWTSPASLIGTFVLALLAHLVTWPALLAALLARRDSPDLTDASDTALLELDRNLDAVPLRAAFSYGAGVLVLHAVLVARTFAAASAPSFAAREVIASGAMTASASLLMVAFVFPILRTTLVPFRGRLGLELSARGLDNERTPMPLAPHLGLASSFLAGLPVVYGLGINLGLDAGTPLPERFTAELAAWGLLILVIIIGVSLILRSMAGLLFGSLDQLARRLDALASTANLSELEPLLIPHSDEIGRAASAANNTLAQLRELADAASAASEGDLRRRVEGEGQLQVAFRTMVSRFDEMVTQIRDSALAVSHASVDIHAATEAQELAVIQQVEGIGAASAAASSLAEAAADIAKAAASVQSDAERTVARSDEVVAQIEAFGAHIERVRELLELISEVADRSDILALNGALEATRAGEAGRGFALVAAEMRRLAERVTDAVVDVRELIADVDASTRATLGATEQSRGLVESTSDAMGQIVDVTRGQDEQTRQVSSAIIEVREIIEESVASTMQTRSTADRLRGQAEQLEQLIAQFEQSP